MSSKFHQFLKQLKSQLNNVRKASNVSIVLGNESCDMDSMVSALSLSYLKSIHPDKVDEIFLPVLNKRRVLFSSRPDNLYLLNKYDIDLDWLLFTDSFSLTAMRDTCNLSVILVDHHVLSADLSELKDHVVEIIDHRPWNKLVEYKKSVQIQLESVASCCTLIASRINYTQFQPVSLLAMLYDVITFDSIGYQASAGKVTAKDLEIATKLEKSLEINTKQIESLRIQRFNELWRVHTDVSHLTSHQLLYSDLKNIKDLYICGIPMLVEAYLKRSDAFEAIETFASENKTSVTLIMGLEVDVDSKITRDLAVYHNNNTQLAHRIDIILQNQFECNPITLNTNVRIQYYQQRNYKHSRKHLMSLLNEL